MAPQRDEIFKQNVNDCVQHIILQKLTNFYTIRSWSFQNICNEVGWPRFLRHPVDRRTDGALKDYSHLQNYKTNLKGENHASHW